MDEFYGLKPKRRTMVEISIAPVLDMLIAVIFFLLLSTTFVQLTQQKVPPAQTHSLAQGSPRTPLGPQLWTERSGDQLQLRLSWRGDLPGSIERRIQVRKGKAYSMELFKASSELARDFGQRFPGEKTLQIGFNADADVQDLMTVMDGTVKHLPALVLMSYQAGLSPAPWGI